MSKNYLQPRSTRRKGFPGDARQSNVQVSTSLEAVSVDSRIVILTPGSGLFHQAVSLFVPSNPLEIVMITDPHDTGA